MSTVVPLTWDDLPEEVVRVAQSMVRGILYNLEDDAPYDELTVAKNFALYALSAAGWQPKESP